MNTGRRHSGAAPAARRILCAGLALGLCSCGRRAERTAPEEEVVARVGGHRITTAAFKAAMARRGGRAPEVFHKPANKHALLDELIRTEVLAQTARERGYFDDPQIRAAINRTIVRRLEQDVLEAAQDQLTVTPDAVEAYYRKHAERFGIPEQVRVAFVHVRVPALVTETKRGELRARAETAREKALELPAVIKDFGQVAAEYSDDIPTRYDGGRTGWLTKGSGDYRWDEHVLEAVFALETPGAIGQVLTGEDGFYVFRLIERKDRRMLPLDQVKHNIRRQILQEKRRALLDAFFEESRAQIQVAVNTNLLEAIEPPHASEPGSGPAAGGSGPPALPTP